MTLSERTVNALIRYKEKRKTEPSNARPAKITVTLGKILIKAVDDKFPSITVKPAEILTRPKLPKNPTSTWLVLDYIQNVDARFTYINFQVAAGSSITELVEVLAHAWPGPESRRSALFKDNADEIAAPVHMRAPNAKAPLAQSSMTAAGGGQRSTRQKDVIVDPEGSAATHAEFSNDFNGGSSSNQPRKKPQTTDALKGMFADYGLDGKSADAQPKQVHRSPPNAPPNAKTAAPAVAPVKQQQPQKKTEHVSYAEHARRVDNKYSPVDKQLEKSDGIADGSFYGNNLVSQRTTPLSAARSGTKDSLDAARRTSALRGSRLSALAEEGDGRTTSSSRHLDADYGDNNLENEGPWLSKNTKPKSLTSASASSAFDATVRNPNSGPSIVKNVTVRPKLASYASYTNGNGSKVGSNPSSKEGQTVWRRERDRDEYSGGGGSIYQYKSQKNIGNSCYMNATMQVLAACPIFVNHLCRAYKSLRQHSEPIIRFHSMMRWLTGQHTSREPVNSNLLEKMRTQLMTLDRVFEEGDGKAQQDAEEALTALLGAVSDECTGKGFRKRDSMIARQSLGGHGSPTKTPKTPTNPVKRPEEGESPLDAPAPPAAAAAAAHGEGGEQKKTMPACCDPVDLMEVKMRDVRKCGSCGNLNLLEAVEHRVHLGVGPAEKKNEPWTVKCVQQLLAADVAVRETLEDYGCEQCKQKKIEAECSKQFVRFGEYIIIVLKRFGYDENYRLRKLTMPVRVPLFMEMANFTDPEGRAEEAQLLNETIEIEDTVKKVKKEEEEEVVKKAEVNSKVRNGTNEWAEVSSEDEKMPAKSEVVESSEGEKMEEGEEEGDETMKEDGVEKKKEQKEQEIIQLSSSSGSQGLDVLAAAASAAADGDSPLGEEGVTPPMATAKLRLETPATVHEKPRRRSEVQQNQHVTTPKTRKRGRSRPTRGGKDERLSTGSRHSLSSSETREEKRSRLEEKMAAVESPDPSYSTTPVDEITIDDDGEEEERERRRRSSLEKKNPVWSAVKEEKKKEKTTETTSEGEEDPFAFNDDAMEERGEAPKKKGKLNLKLFGKKKPLAHQNGQPKKEKVKKFEPPTKGSADRSRPKKENDSPAKSAMEQTGGGRRKAESDEENDEREKADEKMDVGDESDGEKMEKEGAQLDKNVTRRSKQRSGRVDRKEKVVEEEKDEKEEMEKDEDEDDDFFLEGNAVEEKREDPEPEKEEDAADFGSQEGGFVKEGEGEESSADEVVHETPPEEMEQGKPREKKVEAEKEDKKEEELASTEGEEEEEEGKAAMTEDEPVKSASMLDEDEVFGFDSSARHERADLSSSKTPATTLESTSTTSLPAVDETKSQEPSGSDVTLEEEENEKTKQKRERDTNKAEWNKKMLEWRELFKDTDAPPPRDHIMFRPVDDRWMRGQCAQFKLPCEIAKDEHPVFSKLRAQSSLCKVTTAPDWEHIGEMLGDGNCLFRALAWWVTGSEANHVVMRKRIVEFMVKFPDEFGQRMSGPEGQKYTKHNNPMFGDGEWGTQCEIYGAATLFGVDIYTYHEGRWKPYRPLFEWSFAGGTKVTRKTDVSERTQYGIYLTNDNNLHFDVVEYMEPVAPVSDTCYRLLATILHKGETACSGHYVADVYDQDSDQWLHCDDSTIRKRSPISVLEAAMNLGYVLIYGKNSSVVKGKKD